MIAGRDTRCARLSPANRRWTLHMPPTYPRKSLRVTNDVAGTSAALDQEIRLRRVAGDRHVIWKFFVCPTAWGVIVGREIGALVANVDTPAYDVGHVVARAMRRSVGEKQHSTKSYGHGNDVVERSMRFRNLQISRPVDCPPMGNHAGGMGVTHYAQATSLGRSVD